MSPRKSVFLDRDGVINRFPGPGKFVLRYEEFQLLPGVPEGLCRLRAAGFFLVLVTNQSGVGRGLMPLEELGRIHRSMQRDLGGNRLDAIYYCPHHPDEGCACRKPSPEMILRAQAEYGLDLARSFLVGDSGRDIEMGRAAGLRTILCRQHLPPAPEAMEPQYLPEAFARTFTEAVAWILDGQGALPRS